MKFFCTLAGLCLVVQPLLTAPKSLMNIKIDTATRTINVKNQSSGGSTYIIDFGDGIQEKNTTVVDYVHTYAMPGVYQVCMITLLVSPASNTIQADTLCKTIEIPDVSCTALFDVQTDGLIVKMTNQSVGDYKKTYWYIEGIKQWVNKDEVTYPVSKPGYYTVRLRVEGKYCVSEKDTTILLRPDTFTCVANFSFTQMGNNTVIFKNLSSGQWTNLQWIFGDGNYSTESNPTHTYTHPGNFRVKLILLDSLRNITSEYTSFVKLANEALQYLPDFEALTSSDTNRVQLLNRSTAATPCSYLWSFGDGYVSTDSAPEHLYTLPGRYTVCLTQVAEKKRYTTCKPIVVGEEDGPLSFSYLITGTRRVAFSPSWASVPDRVEWDFGDGITSTKEMPVHQYRYDSIYMVNLKAFWGNRSEVVYQIVNLTADPTKLVARFTSQSNQLKATSKRIRYRGALSGDVSRIRFEWNFGEGSIDTLNLDPNYTYTTDSVYTVCLKVFNDLTNDSDQYCQQVRVGNVAVQLPANSLPMSVIQREGFIQLYCLYQTSDQVRIALYDMEGRMVRHIYTGHVSAGQHTYGFNCSKGVYVIRLWGNSHAAIEKIIVF